MSQPDSAYSARWLSKAPVWVRDAIVKVLTGLVLGLLTALILVTLSTHPFPELQDYGQDLGLRVNVYLQRLGRASSGAAVPMGESAQSYVFVDVDPEFGLDAIEGGPSVAALSTSMQPCAALARAHSARYRIAVDGAAPAASSGATVSLNCAAARPINRHLLAELVQQLSAWQPRVIVLDVLIAHEPGIVTGEENRALVQAVQKRSGTGAHVPIVWAEPAVMAGRLGEHAGQVRAEGQRVLVPDPTLRVYAAIALPTPGNPVRRYPKCVFHTGDAVAVPSLPYQAARLASGTSLAGDPVCTPASMALHDNAPRIVYTLPSSGGHQDDVRGASRAQWAHYRQIYNRCLAAAVWNRAGSACADARTYEGKVVVIGASHPARRDRHYTPLGDMSGSEVVINTIRSFASYPLNKDKTFGETLLTKIQIVAWCSLVWFAYFLVSCKLRRTSAPGGSARVRRALTLLLLFPMTLAAVCMLALQLSFNASGPVPSVDVLIPVLAVAMDVYVEQASKLLHWLEGRLERLLGVPSQPEHH